MKSRFTQIYARLKRLDPTPVMGIELGILLLILAAALFGRVVFWVIDLWRA